MGSAAGTGALGFYLNPSLGTAGAVLGAVGGTIAGLSAYSSSRDALRARLKELGGIDGISRIHDPASTSNSLLIDPQRFVEKEFDNIVRKVQPDREKTFTRSVTQASE